MREVDEMLTEREAEHKYTHPASYLLSAETLT